MSIARTAMTDDDGSSTTGTVFNNAWKTALYDQIDAADATGTVQSTTLTGTQNDVVLTANVSLLRCNNASLLTLNGFAAGFDGQRIDLVSIGAGQVDLANQAAGSVAANRIINGVTASRSLAAGTGTATIEYDVTTARWRVIAHEQGAWITPTFAAGNFTTDAGTWTVDAGDVTSYKYRLSGRTLTLSVRIDTSTVATSPTQLRVAIPGGFANPSAASAIQDAAVVLDNSTTTSDVGVANIANSGTFVAVFLKGFGAWAAATNTTGLRFTFTFEVA